MYCTHCKNDNVEEANYCKYCGKPYDHRSEEIELAKKKVRKNEGYGKLGLILAIIFGILFILTEIASGGLNI